MTQRITFTFDNKSLERLKKMVDEGKFTSMADAVRESLAVNRALLSQAKQGFREVIVRDPKTGKERVMVLPSSTDVES